MARREYTGAAPPTTLAAAIASGTLAFTVVSGGGNGYPTGVVGPFFVVLDEGTANEEKILVANRSGDLFNVAGSGRGADGTAAAAHSAGATVRHIHTATDADEANAHVNSDSGHGTTTDIVGVDDPQTLTNKTMSGASNTFSNIPQSAVTDLVTDITALEAADTSLDSRLDTAEAELDQFNHAGTSAPADTTGLSSFPLGLSIAPALTADGWPFTGVLMTFRYTTVTRGVQILYEGGTTADNFRVWHRLWDGSAWKPWMDGYHQRRLATATANSDSSGITTTETTVMSVTASLVTGRRYMVRFLGGFATTVANDFVAVRIREDNATGTEMQSNTFQIPNAGSTPLNSPLEAEYEAVADGNKTFVVTLVRTSGTGTVRRESASTRLAYLYVDYVRD